MSQDQFHWLVVRNSDHLVAKSREVYLSAGAIHGQASPDRVAIYIPMPSHRVVAGAPSAHHVPTVSGKTLHYEVSAQAFDTGDLALAWASTTEGIAFLNHRHDAVLIAFRKPS